MQKLDTGRLLFWARKGTTTLLDQGLISGSNFLINIALARVLGPEPYGAYAVVFSIFLLFGMFHQALLLEPMAVLGPSHFSGRRREYLGALIRSHVVISIVFVLMIGAGYVYLRDRGDPHLVKALAGLLPALPCILLFWMARAATYIECAPGLAVRSSMLYCGLVACGMFGLYLAGVLTPALGFMMMGMASLGAALYLFVKLKPVIGSASVLIWREVCTRHWNFSQWGLAIVVMLWAQVNGNNLMAGYFLGLDDVGGLSMIYAFALPITHVMAASSRLIVPQLAERNARLGPSSITKPVAIASVVFFAGVGLYWACLSLFRESVVDAIYGPAYAMFAQHLPWGLLYLVFSAGMFPAELGLRAILSPDRVFRVQTVTAILTVGLSAIGIVLFGLEGVFMATASASFIGLVMMTLSFQRQAVCHREMAASVSSAGGYSPQAVPPVNEV